MTRRLLVCAALAACAAQKSPEAPHPSSRVVLETASGSHPVVVELARTPADRARGLMNRSHLDPDAGMLFVFEETDLHSFWMKNTFIPLDMIFLDEAARVVGVVANAAPGTLDARDVAKPSRFVLEVNGGWAERHGVRAGDRAVFENVPLW